MRSSEAIDVLNQAICVEQTLALQCEQFALTLTGMWRLSWVPYLEDLASEARSHARKFGKKVVALGATPATELRPVKSGGTAESMALEVLRLERLALDTYVRALTLVPVDELALRTMLEDHIAAEQQHIEELEQLVGPEAEASDIRRAC